MANVMGWCENENENRSRWIWIWDWEVSRYFTFGFTITSNQLVSSFFSSNYTISTLSNVPLPVTRNPRYRDTIAFNQPNIINLCAIYCQLCSLMLLHKFVLRLEKYISCDHAVYCYLQSVKNCSTFAAQLLLLLLSLKTVLIYTIHSCRLARDR
jgi:hypothetical protein